MIWTAPAAPAAKKKKRMCAADFPENPLIRLAWAWDFNAIYSSAGSEEPIRSVVVA
jgi:DNA-binding helix-hairpin-helix protein with protein kinase domain